MSVSERCRSVPDELTVVGASRLIDQALGLRATLAEWGDGESEQSEADRERWRFLMAQAQKGSHRERD